MSSKRKRGRKGRIVGWEMWTALTLYQKRWHSIHILHSGERLPLSCRIRLHITMLHVRRDGSPLIGHTSSDVLCVVWSCVQDSRTIVSAYRKVSLGCFTSTRESCGGCSLVFLVGGFNARWYPHTLPQKFYIKNSAPPSSWYMSRGEYPATQLAYGYKEPSVQYGVLWN